MQRTQLSRREFLKLSGGTAAGLALAASAPALRLGGSSASAEEILLKVQDFQGGQQNYTTAYEKIFALYQEGHPDVKFERRGLGFEEYVSNIRAMLAGGDLPDLVGIYQGGDLFSAIDAKLVLPWQDAFDADPAWFKRIQKTVKGFDDIQGKDGKYYEFPLDAITCVLTYHKDILEAEGLKPWKTLDEFMEVGKALKEKGIYFFSDGTADQGYKKETFHVLVAMQTNGDISMIRQAERGELSWQNDIFFNAMKVVQDMMSPDIVAPEYLSVDAGTSFQMFYDKKVWGQWYAGEWLAGEYIKNMPDAVAGDTIGVGNVPIPTKDANPNIFIGGPGQCYALSATGKHPEVATDFAKFLSTPDVCKLLAQNDIHPAGELPDAANYTENKVLKLFMDTYAKADGFVSFTTLVPDVLDHFKTNIGLMMLGKMGPEEFLKDMDATYYKG